MNYENLCMYCFKDMNGETICPHCGGDSRAAVPQVQMLPGTLIYHDRFLVGRALGQDSNGIVYNAMDTKRGGVIRIREYLPRNCAERLNDGGVVPVAGMEEAFETGMRKLRASVDSVEDPAKRHFYFEENGTAYIAQRKGASGASSAREREDDEPDGGNRRQIILYIAIAAAVVLAVAIGVILIFNFMTPTDDQTTIQPLASPSASATWAPRATPTPTPYATPTFAALVDPELNWMEYTAPGTTANPQRPNPTATQRPTVQGNQSYPTIKNGSDERSVRELQQRLVQLGWLSYANVTGRYDSATEEAVRDFQHYVNEYCSPAEKLVEDGIAGRKTQQWLYNSSVSLARPTATPAPKVTARPNDGTVGKNSSAAAVRDVQNKLIVLGLLPEGSADGRYGSATQAAVQRFQNRVNQLQGYAMLPTDGTADALTRAWLNYYAEEWTHRVTAAPQTATPRPTPTPTSAGTPAPTSPNVDANASRERILEAQKLLQQVGLLGASEADGVYGERTAEAVRLFQAWINQLRGENTLQVTGVVDPLTMRYLEYCVENGRMYDLPTAVPATQPATQAPTFEPEPEVTEVPPEQQAGGDGITPDSETESIAFMQEMLAATGLMDPSQVDGDYGAATAEAVRAFQRAVNERLGYEALEVTGQCDPQTLFYLEQAYDDGWQLGEPEATEEPTPEPTEEPTPEPTEEPTPEPTEEPTPEPTEEPTPEPIDGVAPESPTEDILRMQQQLNAVGLLSEEWVNGTYTAETEEAVRNLQRAVNAYNGREVLAVTGMCDSQTLNFLVSAAQRGMDLRELAGLTTPEPTPEPTPVPTEVPTPEPTEEPTPEPQVGTIEYLGFTLSGREVGGLVELEPGQYEIGWSAEGDVQSYFVYLYDGAGNQLNSAENVDMRGFSVSTSAMRPGEVYELRVGALPVNGTADDIYWQSLQMILPVVETPVPTEAPTPPPSVSAPVISIGSSVYQQEGVQYISDSTAIFSWMAEGQVESYTVNLSYQDGTSYSLGTTTDTSRSVNTDQLQPGLYRIYVGATPVGGGPDSTVWSELVFGIPAPAATPEPEPEITPEPAPPEETRIDYLDANSSPDDIQTVQMALYRYGLLDAQSVQPGSLDAGTLSAVAAFQQRVNDVLGLGLYVIDPSVDAYVDTQTLDLLLYQNLDLSA